MKPRSPTPRKIPPVRSDSDKVVSHGTGRGRSTAIASARGEAFHRVADILRCKWTIAVLDAISRGRARPSEIQRDNPGLTPKVLSQRLRKLTDYGLLTRRVYAEIPPRVEYAFTPRGRELVDLVASIAAFADSWATGLSSQQPVPRSRSARTRSPGG